MDAERLRALSAQSLNESDYGEVDVVLLYIEQARRHAESACATLRAGGSEIGVVEAMERTQRDLAETAKLLTQRAFFSAPKQQLTLM